MTNKIICIYSVQRDDLIYIYFVTWFLLINTPITSHSKLFAFTVRMLKVYFKQISSVQYHIINYNHYAASFAKVARPGISGLRSWTRCFPKTITSTRVWKPMVSTNAASFLTLTERASPDDLVFWTLPRYLAEDCQTFSVKCQIMNILSFVGHAVSAASVSSAILTQKQPQTKCKFILII